MSHKVLDGCVLDKWVYVNRSVSIEKEENGDIGYENSCSSVATKALMLD